MLCSVCQEVEHVLLKEQGLRKSKEWTTTGVIASDGPKGKRKSLNDKLSSHKMTKFHAAAIKVVETRSEDVLRSSMVHGRAKHIAMTCHVFNTAYHIAKENLPYSQFEGLIELQKCNGCDIGTTLHSRFSATEIVRLISSEMKQQLCQVVQANGCKVSIMLDESTTISRKSTVMIYLRVNLFPINETTDALAFPLDLAELDGLDAKTITDTLLSVLKKYKFEKRYLEKHLIGVCSDGASTMVGSKSGVLTRLKELYPDILLWHCMCHRIELAVGDAVKSVTAVNHVKVFMDKLYSLYSQSPSLNRELQTVAASLGVELLKIGRVFDIRWSASSYRTVNAIWRNYSALCEHFLQCSENPAKKPNHSMYSGLLTTMKSSSFVHSLAVLRDALHEISILSQHLQSNDTGLVVAYRRMKQAIQALKNQKQEITGESYQEYETSEGEFKGIKLGEGRAPMMLNRSQFLQTLIDNISSRLDCTVASLRRTSDGNEASQDTLHKLLDEIDVLDPEKWPTCVGSPWPDGERKLKQLCNRVKVEFAPVRAAFRDYIDDSNVKPAAIKSILSIIATYPVTSADCERGFSTMNLICTKLRNSLLVENISHLLFVSLVGPPVSKFQSEPYVIEWLKRKHRDAVDTRVRPISAKFGTRYQPLWQFM